MSNDTDYREIFAAHAAESASILFRQRYDAIAPRCESPIERIMLGGLLWLTEFSNFYWRAGVSELPYTWPNEPGGDKLWVFVQPELGPYRPDFLIRQTLQRGDEIVPVYAVVECDGHDYHERTKEQAARDKQRDRWMTDKGIQVYRFTGSEIWRNPVGCTMEIARSIESAFGRIQFE